ncbi:MAG: glycine cleavage T C-terminal barrel domain-containing protein [Spartobacteria bacterium]
MHDGLFFDLSARTKIRVTGQDRQRYLNGQLTNDVRKATESEAIAACILNAKGKMDAHAMVASDGEAFMLDADPVLRETLPSRLERYVIADDVILEDVTERLSILHVIGAALPELPNCRTIAANRFGEAGKDLWMEASVRDETFARLAETISFCDEAQAEVFRIEQGIPRWGAELTADVIPPEAGLESNSVDYGKGCYIGQEVISRMKMSGQRNKALCGLVSDSPLGAGMRLQNDEGKEVGWITSAARSKRVGGEMALGYVKRGFNAAGTQLKVVAAEGTIGVEIVDLPFKVGE